MKKYNIKAISKKNHYYLWQCNAESENHAIEITYHLLNVVKGLKDFEYKVVEVREVKE